MLTHRRGVHAEDHLVPGKWDRCGQSARTVFACWPFCPFSDSKDTFCPSVNSLYPDPSMDEKWAKTSGGPSLGVMNPNPFDVSNHLTVPSAILIAPISPRSMFAGGPLRQPATILDPRDRSNSLSIVAHPGGSRPHLRYALLSGPGASVLLGRCVGGVEDWTAPVEEHSP